MLQNVLAVLSPVAFALVAWLRRSAKPRPSAIEELRGALADERAFVETFKEGTPERAALEYKLRLGVARYVDERVWETPVSILEWRRLQRILNITLAASTAGLLTSGSIAVASRWLSSDAEKALEQAMLLEGILLVAGFAATVFSWSRRAKARAYDRQTEPTLSLPGAEKPTPSPE